MTKDTPPTGEGASAKNDVADPHPSTEENYDKIPNPGGTRTWKDADPGANSYVHDGKAPPHGSGRGRNGKA